MSSDERDLHRIAGLYARALTNVATPERELRAYGMMVEGLRQVVRAQREQARVDAAAVVTLGCCR